MDNEFKTYPLKPEVEDITCEAPVSVEQTMSDSINNGTTVGAFFGTLQESVVAIWKYHLSTNKHFIHVELERTYHLMLEYTDNLIEIYQGIIGGVLDKNDYVNTISYVDSDCLVYLTNLVNYINESKDVLFGNYSDMLSKIDDILEGLDSVIYKLTAFKEEPVLTYESFCYSQYGKLNENCDNCDNTDDEEEEE